MANRMFNQFQGALEKNVVDLFAEVSFGAAGAPTLVRGKGIASIAVGATGVYTVTLQDTYQRVLSSSALWKQATAPAAPVVHLAADDSANATPTLTLNTRSGATLTAPASGDTLLLSIRLSNSSAL